MIKLENITYEVVDNGERRKILDNISYTFKDNCVTAITGHNGSGKSTLTKIIMGIIKPTSGKIFFNDKDITNLSIDERARLGINYAFQQPINFHGITVKELIDIASNEENSVKKACDYLSKVGICARDYIDREFDKTLSGGEQKRIELALTLAKKGKVVIYDEPEAGIDLWSFDRLNDILQDDICYIIVSHQLRLLERADEILVLNSGRIEREGKTEDILKHLAIGRCGRARGGKR